MRGVIDNKYGSSERYNNWLQEIPIIGTAGKSYSWGGTAKSTKQEFSLRETKEQTKKKYDDISPLIGSFIVD